MGLNMDAENLLKSGHLSKARENIVQEIKLSPEDIDKRMLYVKILICCGELDKALKNLDIINAQQTDLTEIIQEYTKLIDAEKNRAELFQNNETPEYFPTDPVYKSDVQQLRKQLFDKPDDALKTIEIIENKRPVLTGTLNEKKVDGIVNTDITLAFSLEAFIDGKYVWIPFETLKELTITQPKFFFDLIWSQASLTTYNGLCINCYLPVLYPNSYSHENDQIKLGKMTDWEKIGRGLYKAYGQQIFNIGTDEIPILEIRNLTFDFQDQGNSNES